MQYRQFRLPPGAGWGILALLLLLIVAFVVIPAQVAGESFERLGLSMLQGLVVGGVMIMWRTAAFTVHVSKKLVPEPVAQTLQNAFMNMQMGQEVNLGHTGELVRQRFSVSVGGGIVPLVMCLYFATAIENFEQALPWIVAGIVVVGVVCFAVIKNVPGQGVRIPMFIPPVAVAVASMVIREYQFAPQVAYISAVFGVLASTGLVPIVWPRMRARLDAPNVVIGGPGVFGGLFLACLAAGLFS